MSGNWPVSKSIQNWRIYAMVTLIINSGPINLRNSKNYYHNFCWLGSMWGVILSNFLLINGLETLLMQAVETV